MATLQSFKVQGQTTLDVAIATKTITVDSDGFIRFSDANGRPRSLQMSGDLGVFMTEILTGASGLASALMK